MEGKLRLGISSCLLGEKVRFDGGHKRDPFLVETLGRYVEYVPVCPEVEMGLSTPREALRLVGDPEKPRLVFSRSGEDITGRMTAWARRRVGELESENLCGFIFKSRSPSSGMERVKLYDRNGVPKKEGVGLFARIFMEHFPLLPVEEDGRLHDPGLRETFIESIFTLKRWRETAGRRGTPSALVDFHTRHKLLILAHSTELYREMGRLVAQGGTVPTSVLYEGYLKLLMKALHLNATVKKNVNVLQHMLGYFKRQLSADEKQEALEVIGHYHHGLVPLVVPLTLINHFVRKYGEPYLQQQVYLNPHPLELRLRNHS
ncbi:YbgA family protein [Trichloromonas sp.]|uniref:YbgA family protein n=1 Tax=Trichloromonas sp. TaxID=3069249 RepID=UPI003D817E51